MGCEDTTSDVAAMGCENTNPDASASWLHTSGAKTPWMPLSILSIESRVLPTLGSRLISHSISDSHTKSSSGTDGDNRGVGTLPSGLIELGKTNSELGKTNSSPSTRKSGGFWSECTLSVRPTLGESPSIIKSSSLLIIVESVNKCPAERPLPSNIVVGKLASAIVTSGCVGNE